MRARSSRRSCRSTRGHFNGFDDKILSMYVRGMSVRDIRAHLEEIYGVSVDADLISRVTDSVVDELKAWQHRLLDALYLVVYLDALVVKIRDKGVVQNKAVYLAVGVGMDGAKDVHRAHGAVQRALRRLQGTQAGLR